MLRVGLKSHLRQAGGRVHVHRLRVLDGAVVAVLLQLRGVVEEARRDGLSTPGLEHQDVTRET